MRAAGAAAAGACEDRAVVPDAAEALADPVAELVEADVLGVPVAAADAVVVSAGESSAVDVSVLVVPVVDAHDVAASVAELCAVVDDSSGTAAETVLAGRSLVAGDAVIAGAAVLVTGSGVASASVDVAGARVPETCAGRTVGGTAGGTTTGVLEPGAALMVTGALAASRAGNW